MDQVRIGMIGCGGMARAHLRQLSEIPEAQVVALADPDGEQIGRCGEKFSELQHVPTFESARAMLDAVQLDAVEINTPHSQHSEQVLMAFERGLHVLVEKPFVVGAEMAQKAIAARDKAGTVGLLSYQRHYSPTFRYLKNQLRSESQGPVTFMHAFLGQSWKRGTAGSWRQDPELSGGGQLNDSGSHILDVLLWASGLEPETVTAFTDNRGTPVDIDSTVSVRFRGGAIASLNIIGDFPIWHEEWTVACERGGFMMRGDVISVLDEKGKAAPVDKLPEGSNPDRNFIGAILRGEEIEATFEDGLKVIGLTEAAWRSAEQGGAPIPIADKIAV